jgi:hypothetical protein
MLPVSRFDFFPEKIKKHGLPLQLWAFLHFSNALLPYLRNHVAIRSACVK